MSRQILNGWKEISNHIERGVRTAQRWEVRLGMPVHRPALKDRSAVVAFTDELDRWLSRTAPDTLDANGEESEETLVRVHDNMSTLAWHTSELASQTRALTGATEAIARDSAQPDRIENARSPRRGFKQEPGAMLPFQPRNNPRVSCISLRQKNGDYQKVPTVTKSMVTVGQYCSLTPVPQ